jgi:hypothetical protein
MSIFWGIRNERFLRELQRELNTDVLLFGLDGFTYFGRLQQIEDCRIALLTPAIVSNSHNVEILSPGGDIQQVKFTRIDLWQIVGKGTGISADPLADSSSSSSSSSSVGDSRDNGTEARQHQNEMHEALDRQDGHHLVRILCRMIGDNVALTTLGGFLFTGLLGDVDGEVAIMTVDDIFLPATSSAISDNAVGTVVINLEALTSVSGQNCSC